MAERDEPSLRRYTDREVRLLLERAARAEGTPSAARPKAHGMTLAELEDVAAEARIDVGRLREAAREFEAESVIRPVTAPARVAGAPLALHIERTLPFESDADAIQALVLSLASRTGETGEAGSVGRAFTWTSSTNGGRTLQVQVSAQRGTTTLRVDERYGELVGGLFGGVMGGIGGGAGVGGTVVAGTLGSAALAIAIPVMLIAGSYAACRFGYAAYVRRRARTLHALIDDIVRDLTSAHEDELPSESGSA